MMRAPWYSSYEDHNFGELFYALMRIYQPKKVVELGTKAGYSAYHMARGLQSNGVGTLDCYDLWEHYKFTSVRKSIAEKNLKKFKDIVKLTIGDVMSVAKKYKEVDILHIDLGNHAEMMDALIPSWIKKVRQLIIIEGGSLERDKVAWALKYKKKPLAPWLKRLQKKNKNMQYITVNAFPSLTLISNL